MSFERLDKFIASQSTISRSEIKIYIRKGLVSVNGLVVKKPEEKVDTEKDTVTLNGNNIIYKKHLYIMLNKPSGVISATNDKKEKTVLDILPANLLNKSLFPVGRLDKDTEGLLIITNDGDFSHQITSPKKEIYKVYEATVNRKLTQDDIYKFANGITFADGTKCLPAKLEIMEKQKALVTICEGKFHQVKKMFIVIGAEVLSLKRIKIGNLSLDPSLEKGKARELTDEEIRSIFL